MSGGFALFFVLLGFLALMAMWIRTLHIFAGGAGNWQNVFRCKGCGNTSHWSHQFRPCGHCASMDHPEQLIGRERFFGGWDIKGEGEHG